MLVKDGGLANKYVSVSGTGEIGDPYVVEHSLSVLPDTAGGDLASISGIHLGNGGVITHNSTSQTIAVPATAKLVRLATKGGATNFEIDAVGDASANSPGYIPEEAIDYYPITGGSMTLKVYGTAGYLYYYFLG